MITVKSLISCLFCTSKQYQFCWEYNSLSKGNMELPLQKSTFYRFFENTTENVTYFLSLLIRTLEIGYRLKNSVYNSQLLSYLLFIYFSLSDIFFIKLSN